MKKEMVVAVNYDDQLMDVVDRIAIALRPFNIVIEDDEEKNEESYQDGDGRMWYIIKEGTIE